MEENAVSMTATETELVYQLQLKNETAFTNLYKLYAPTLFNGIKKNVSCMLSAEDILQNVFLKIWLNIQHYQSDKGSIFTWMITIARNESIDYLRSRHAKSQRLTTEIRDTEIPAKTSIDPRISRIDLLISLALLPEKSRKIIDLYNTGYTSKELSIMFDTPEGTIKTILKRSFTKLRKVLG
jgi:RNA polymerase sigma factor (sigma-70 family)